MSDNRMSYYDTVEAIKLIHKNTWLPKKIIKLVLRENDRYLRKIGVIKLTDKELKDFWK